MPKAMLRRLMHTDLSPETLRAAGHDEELAQTGLRRMEYRASLRAHYQEVFLSALAGRPNRPQPEPIDEAWRAHVLETAPAVGSWVAERDWQPRLGRWRLASKWHHASHVRIWPAWGRFGAEAMLTLACRPRHGINAWGGWIGDREREPWDNVTVSDERPADSVCMRCAELVGA